MQLCVHSFAFYCFWGLETLRKIMENNGIIQYLQHYIAQLPLKSWLKGEPEWNFRCRIIACWWELKNSTIVDCSLSLVCTFPLCS